MAKKPTLNEQEKQLRQAARERGLTVRPMPSLDDTPYRAMQPRAARELGVRCHRRTIGYGSAAKRTRRRLVMDIRHEIIEYDQMSRGRRYKSAHKVANRRQRNVKAVR